MDLAVIRSNEQPLSKSHQISQKSVTIIGAGVAGMSAACSLAESGLRVQLVEQRGYLGGRASSYLHPGVNEVIDNCQHVLFGCCTNLVGFYRRTGVRRGFKAAGGIRTSKVALSYLVLIDEVLGGDWLDPDYFRIGASSLLDDLLLQREKERTGRYPSPDIIPKD